MRRVVVGERDTEQETSALANERIHVCERRWRVSDDSNEKVMS